MLVGIDGESCPGGSFVELSRKRFSTLFPPGIIVACPGQLENAWYVRHDMLLSEELGNEVVKKKSRAVKVS